MGQAKILYCNRALDMPVTYWKLLRWGKSEAGRSWGVDHLDSVRDLRSYPGRCQPDWWTGRREPSWSPAHLRGWWLIDRRRSPRNWRARWSRPAGPCWTGRSRCRCTRPPSDPMNTAKTLSSTRGGKSRGQRANVLPCVSTTHELSEPTHFIH